VEPVVAKFAAVFHPPRSNLADLHQLVGLIFLLIVVVVDITSWPKRQIVYLYRIIHMSCLCLSFILTDLFGVPCPVAHTY
jgi:hypothetical protein